MKRIIILLVLAASLRAQTKVKVWEEKIVIPTYALKSPSPLPEFHVYRGIPHYPYPLFDEVSTTKSDKTWNAVLLENEYLKVTVMPEMGGKIYSIFDKVANRETLYSNSEVKYAPGIAGYWAAGGIEWNFPDVRPPTSATSVDYTIRQDRDGSAEVVVGDTERIQGLEWQVAIRLRPGVRCVETEALLSNRTQLPGRYWYWATAAAHASDDLRFVNPARYAFQHDVDTLQPYPMSEGSDRSLWRNIPNQLELFAWHSFRDFIGVYYEKSDWGLLHVADHRILPGKKLWTGGAAKEGYVEFEAGRTDSQATHAFMAPLHADRFVEYWYPVNKLGGAWDEANSDGALRLRREAGKVSLAIDMNRVVENAEVVLEDGAGKMLETWKTTFHPGTPFIASKEVAGSGAVELRVRSAGKDWIHYRSDFPIDGNDNFKPPTTDTKKIGAAQAAYELAQRSDRASVDLTARGSYLRAASMDTSYVAPRVALGLSYLRSGDYKNAASHLQDALRLAPANEEAHYYYGLLLRATGNLPDAKTQLSLAAASGMWGEDAREVLGEIAISQNAWPAAIEQLSLSTNPKARTLLALAYRVSGNAVRAKSLLAQLRQELPLDYLILNEASLAGDPEADKELWRLLDREPDHVLELAFDYASVKRVEGRTIIEKAITRSTGKNYAMWSYALGWMLDNAGNANSARTDYEAGAHAPTALAFPHRVIEIEILRRALAALPAKSAEWGRTAYYLGNALAARYRPEEALEQWRAAALYDKANPYSHYELSVAALTAGNAAEQTVELDRAVQAAPDEYRLYLIRDQSLVNAGAPEGRRLAALDTAPDNVKHDSRLALTLALLYARAGRVKEASAQLEQSALPADPDVSGIWKYISARYTEAGQTREAALAMEKALGSDAHPKAMLDLVALYERVGKRDDAQAWIKRAAEYPGANLSMEDEYYRADALGRLRRFDEARVGMERVAAQDAAGSLGREATLTLRHWKSAGVIK